MFAYLMGSPALTIMPLPRYMPSMAHAGGVVGTFEENKVSGLCFCFADVLALFHRPLAVVRPTS